MVTSIAVNTKKKTNLHSFYNICNSIELFSREAKRRKFRVRNKLLIHPFTMLIIMLENSLLFILHIKQSFKFNGWQRKPHWIGIRRTLFFRPILLLCSFAFYRENNKMFQLISMHSFANVNAPTARESTIYYAHKINGCCSCCYVRFHLLFIVLWFCLKKLRVLCFIIQYLFIFLCGRCYQRPTDENN